MDLARLLSPGDHSPAEGQAQDAHSSGRGDSLSATSQTTSASASASASPGAASSTAARTPPAAGTAGFATDTRHRARPGPREPKRPPRRQLLPAPDPVAPPEVDSENDDDSQAARKRRQIVLACEACRRRKVKCDAVRPQCRPCETRNIQCVYREPLRDTLKRKLDELTGSNAALDVFRAIQSRSPAEAAEIFQRIRAGADPDAVVQQLGAADLLLQVQLEPETKFRYVFPDRPQMPAFLLAATNPYLQSLVYEWTTRGESEMKLSARPPSRSPSAYALPSPSPTSTTPSMRRSPTLSQEHAMIAYLRPYHAAAVVDTRIDLVRPSEWTSVSTDDRLMRELLRAYFLQEFSWFTCFHKDHFLDDMLARRHQLCSPLLVNAVLAVGCQSYHKFSQRAEYWNPKTLGYQFLAEAKRLWELEFDNKDPSEHSLTTIQAALIINVTLNIAGLDVLGKKYMQHATQVVQHMGLFDYPREPSAFHPRTQHARDFTAWCYFYWQSMLCLHFKIAPWIPYPPAARLPCPRIDAGWYGDFYIQYAASNAHILMQLPETFKAKMDFAIVLTRGLLQAPPASVQEHAFDGGTARLNHQLRELRGWFEALPESLKPANIVFPWQFKTHMAYYDVCIQICDLLLRKEQLSYRFNPTVSDNKIAADLRNEMQECHRRYETLIRLYYLRHGYDYGDVQIVQHLCFIGLYALDRIREGAQRSALQRAEAKTSSPPAAAATAAGTAAASANPNQRPLAAYQFTGQKERAPVSSSTSWPPAQEMLAKDLPDIRSTLVMAAFGLNKQGQSFYAPQTLLHVIQSRMTAEDSMLVGKFANVQEEGQLERRLRATHIRSQFPVNVRKDPGEQTLGNWMQQYADLSLEDPKP